MTDESRRGPHAVVFDEVLRTEREAIGRRRPRAPSQPFTGLALSGGGIRSAATAIGAIQALHVANRFEAFDYLSTVSGGGYAGACLSAAMSEAGGGTYPFGKDVRDAPVVAQIRNYSNYLLPRNRSKARNLAEAGVILLRGLLANAVCVIAFMLLAVALTAIAFSSHELEPNFLPRLFRIDPRGVPFATSAAVAGALVAILIVWAMLRSWPSLDRVTNDTSSRLLTVSYVLLFVFAGVLFLDLQPLAIEWVRAHDEALLHGWLVPTDMLAGLPGALLAFAGAVSALASVLGKFLQTSKRSQRWQTIALRWLTHAAVVMAALIVPTLLWASYVVLCAELMSDPPPGGLQALWNDRTFRGALVALGVSWAIMLGLRSNGYSLHQLYRDRLSKAFLMSSQRGWDASRLAARRLVDSAKAAGDLPPLDGLKLSQLRQSNGPYPLINAALNVQGSLAANKRGRDADFFVFTPDFVGSELTRYAPTAEMEQRDSRLDLASAMAISGAAASANMGGKTIRILSPTLALLNIRLGYYLKNPRYIGEDRTRAQRIARFVGERMDRFYLFIEMLNALHERRYNVYLTDGGHIENLGIYALLRRRCKLIVAIDAEADPELGFESLLKLERYARIDLGVRINLPWEQVAATSRATSAAIPDHAAECLHGPHVAFGRIFYPPDPKNPDDDGKGLLVYVKSSLSGDERDYLLDYAERKPDFPHETTGDQFFSEEQFEMYRALGFHMVTGLFGSDRIAFVKGPEGFEDEDAARAELGALLPG